MTKSPCQCGTYSDAAERAAGLLIKMANDDECAAFAFCVSLCMARFSSRLYESLQAQAMLEGNHAESLSIILRVKDMIAGCDKVTMEDERMQLICDAFNASAERVRKDIDDS